MRLGGRVLGGLLLLLLLLSSAVPIAVAYVGSSLRAAKRERAGEDHVGGGVVERPAVLGAAALERVGDRRGFARGRARKECSKYAG